MTALTKRLYLLATLFAALVSSDALGEQKQKLGDWDVHYMVVRKVTIEDSDYFDGWGRYAITSFFGCRDKNEN